MSETSFGTGTLKAHNSDEYRQCARCVMDSSDPEIRFDENGVCSHCYDFEENIKPYWHPDEEGKRRLEQTLNRIRSEGVGKRYDCILGISGGVDSSYLATQLPKWNLRPLVVHVDAGWNSELAVRNIELVTTKLGLDLHTVVIDWDEIRDLQVAYLQSHVANQDTPQDHAFIGALYQAARDHDIKYIVSGSNYATEGVLPTAWGYDAMDSEQLRGIHKRFGTVKLRSYPVLSFNEYFVKLLRGMEVFAPLNLMTYNKDDAIALLEQDYGWRYYGGKHYESVWTKWFQAHYLPTKFGYDKRKAHLSSLIVAGSMTRERALEILEQPLYDPEQLRQDTDFVAKKLGLSTNHLIDLVHAPGIDFSEYETNHAKIEQLRKREERDALVQHYARAAMSPKRIYNWIRRRIS